jgi:hypothetical protein
VPCTTYAVPKVAGKPSDGRAEDGKAECPCVGHVLTSNVLARTTGIRAKSSCDGAFDSVELLAVFDLESEWTSASRMIIRPTGLRVIEAVPVSSLDGSRRPCAPYCAEIVAAVSV